MIPKQGHRFNDAYLLTGSDTEFGLMCARILVESGVTLRLVAGPHASLIVRNLALLFGKPFDTQINVIQSKEFWKSEKLTRLTKAETTLGISGGVDYLLPSNFLSERYILNLHPAPLPINRGSHHSFWAIMNNEPMGATIHWMIEELDAGPIVDKVAYEIPTSFVASDTQKFSELLALELLRNNIAKILDGQSVSKPQVGKTSNHKKKEILEASAIFSNLQYTGDQILRLSRAVCNKDNGFLVHSENQVFRVVVSKVQNLTNS